MVIRLSFCVVGVGEVGVVKGILRVFFYGLFWRERSKPLPSKGRIGQAKGGDSNYMVGRSRCNVIRGVLNADLEG